MIYLLEITLCWLFFYLLYVLFLKKETFFQLNRWYLMATLLLSLALPSLDLSDHNISQTVELAAVYIQPISTTLQTIEVTATSSHAIQEGMNVWMLLQFIYGLGVLFLLARFVLSLSKLYFLYRKSKIEKHHDFTFITTSESHLPFSFFYYLFWSEHHQISKQNKVKIIQHEKAHMQQGHSVDVLVMEFIGIFFWCSPLIYFYKKSLRTVHEYLADAAVLKNTPIQTYGKLLLTQSMSRPTMMLANHFFQSPLKNRIIMMTKSKSPNLAMFKYLLALPILLAMVLIFSNKNLIAQKQTTASTDEIYKVIDEMPLFPGCEQSEPTEQKECAQLKMLNYIYNTVKYPQVARQSGIQGIVVVQFVVDKTGRITLPKIERSIGGGCDEEVLRVVDMMPRWIPGRQSGQNVAVRYHLPVKFKLEGSTEKEIKKEGLTQPREALPLANYTVSPNPTSGQIKLQFEAEKMPLNIELLDLNGKVLENRNLKNFHGQFQETFDLSQTAKGTVIIKVSQDGKFYFDKIVVQ